MRILIRISIDGVVNNCLKRWIRGEFIRSQVSHEHIVVHGHTINSEVEWLPNRIGIDTGAYETGLLTALVLEGEGQRLLQTK